MVSCLLRHPPRPLRPLPTCRGTSLIFRMYNQRCDDSKKDDLMDRTDANIRSWIAFRFSCC